MSYSLGVLKKSELFRSHVYGVSSDGKERMEAQAALIAEKEKAVVGALETGRTPSPPFLFMT